MDNNSELSVANSNLTPWCKGQSGNIRGRPKGSKNWSTVVKELLNDDGLVAQLRREGLIRSTGLQGIPLKLIAIAQLAKAIDGDIKAAEWLRKFVDDKGHSNEQTRIVVVSDIYTRPEGAPKFRH